MWCSLNQRNDRPTERGYRGGRDAVVVVAAEEYERLTRPVLGLVEFLCRSPLAGVELDLERPRDVGREIDL